MEEQIQNYLGGQVWWLFGLAGLFLIRNLIESLIQAIFFSFGSDFNNDDIVLLENNQVCRIVRIGITKTTFFCYEIVNDRFTGKARIASGKKLVIQNSVLANAKIYKPLDNMDLSRWDTPIEDPNCRRNGKHLRRRDSDE